METAHTINWFDLVLGFIVLISALAGLKAGLARVIIGLAAAILALLTGFWCYRLVAVRLEHWITNQAVAGALAFALIFVIVLLGGAIFASLLSNLLKWVGLSWFNHLLGGLAGALRGILLASVMTSIIVAFATSPPPEFLRNSQLVPYSNEVAAVLVQMAPNQLKQSFLQQMQNLKDFREARQRRS